MALKTDRQLNVTTIRFTCDVAAEEGQFLIYKASQPTGHAVGQGINELAPVATTQTGTGNPPAGTAIAGLLVTPVVSIDVNRQHRNWNKTEQLVNENVLLLTDGEVWTNSINGTPVAGSGAYVGPSGKVQTTQVNSIPAVGKFLTAKDADGYALVSVKMA